VTQVQGHVPETADVVMLLPSTSKDFQESGHDDDGLSSIDTDSDEETLDAVDVLDTDSDELSDDSEVDSEDDLIPSILDALDTALFEEVATISDEYLDEIQSTFTSMEQTALDALEVSFEAIQLADQTESQIVEDSLPQAFGLVKQDAPPLLCRHPEPYSGRDDDPTKLKEIAADTLVKLGIYNDSPNMSTRILFGPDHKIGKNLMSMVNQKQYAPFLPEFPCLHARKSRITITFSAHKNSGLMQLLQYMRDDDSTEWAKLISAHHIDVATRHVMRLAKALRLSFILKFSTELSEDEAHDLFQDLQSLTGPEVAARWHDRFNAFLERGKSSNGTFALHIDIMLHLEGIGAVALAERLGGEEGYNLLLASTKSSLAFSFLNGATAYSPYSIQLLYHHYRAGTFYEHLKKCLFSTPLTEGSVNMATDTKREMDHQVITKGFRSGSTMASVMRRTALADELSEVHKIRERKRHTQSKKRENDNLGWTTTKVDINHIVPTVLLIFRRGGLSMQPDPNPYNVYTKTKIRLSTSILDKNCVSVGEYLVKKYIASERLFGCNIQDIPDSLTVSGPKELVSKAVKGKGITIKRATGAGVIRLAKSERQQKEESRKKRVSVTVQRVECLSSEMNACQALVKPDCTKPKVNKALSMAEAIKNCLCSCLSECPSKASAKNKMLQELNLVRYRCNRNNPLPENIATTVKIVTIEFAGVRFKSKAITGLEYIKSVENDYIQGTINQMPCVQQIVIVEEKYGYTPDSFKAATRDQRVSAKARTAIHHLKTGREIISAEKFDKAACVTSSEGKSLITTYVAQNMDKFLLKHNISIVVDSEFKESDCSCHESTCTCLKHAVPLKCVFSKSRGLEEMTYVQDIKQRKGEAEMAQVDWLLQSMHNLKPGEAAASIVTSGDFDAIIIHMFVISRHWARNADNKFLNPVYVLLQKPSGTDVYNITSMIEILEVTHTDIHIAEKIALTLCIGGNDFIPKLYQVNHSKVLKQFINDMDYRDGLFTFQSENITIDQDKYVTFIKELYCKRQLGDPKTVPYEEVRRHTMIQKRKQASGPIAYENASNPKKWLPPQTALSRMAELIDLQIQYLLTAGDASAPLPDFLAANCLKRTETGEVEYDFGCDSFMTSAELSSLTPTTPVKKSKKRIAQNTPQKGRRKKIPLKSSTPVKQSQLPQS